MRLPLYCQKAKVLHCLFDLTYSTRLWCVFEMAVFLRLRRNPKIVFTSISQRIMELIVLVLIISFRAIVDGIDAIANADIQIEDNKTYINTKTNATAFETRRVLAVVSWVVQLASIMIVYYFGREHFRTVIDLRRSLTNYDVVCSELSEESDRLFLLEILNDLFTDSKDSQEQLEGIDKLNELLRYHIPRQLPVTGLRSWKLFRYISAVIAFGYENIVWFYDSWAWHTNQLYYEAYQGDSLEDIKKNAQFAEIWGRIYSYENFLSVVALVWQFFILVPFSVYLLCAEVRFLVWVQDKLKWPDWTSYALFMPILVIVEMICGWRNLFTLNVENLMWYLLVPYDYSDIYPVVVRGVFVYDQNVVTKTVFRYQPWAGLDWLWMFWEDPNDTSSFKWILPVYRKDGELKKNSHENHENRIKIANCSSKIVKKCEN